MAVSAVSGANTSFVTSAVNKAEDTNGITGKFSDFLDNAINQVDVLQKESSQLTQDFAVGKTDNIQQVMVAGEKASIALQFTMQVRTKIMEAYNEIMRMAI